MCVCVARSPPGYMFLQLGKLKTQHTAADQPSREGLRVCSMCVLHPYADRMYSTVVVVESSLPATSIKSINKKMQNNERNVCTPKVKRTASASSSGKSARIYQACGALSSYGEKSHTDLTTTTTPATPVVVVGVRFGVKVSQHSNI